MTSSVWPRDIVGKPIPFDRNAPNHLRCFLMCPFTPEDRFDDLFALVQQVCAQVEKGIACTVECIRADNITSAGVIHSEIWTHIAQSDVVVADVSGLNANVMIELGVAAAVKSKHQVIIIKDEDAPEPFQFDIIPARHILYKRTARRFQKLATDLQSSLVMSLSAAPFEHQGQPITSLPLDADFSSGADVHWLASPDTAHRRIIRDVLEYGSFFVFRNSWLAVGDLLLSHVEIDAEIRFSDVTRATQGGWIGISLRNQSYFANYGHLFYLRTDGKVMRTEPKDDAGNYDDIEVGTLPNFLLDTTTFHRFKAKLTDAEFVFDIDGVSQTLQVPTLPFVYASGRVLLQTHRVRAGLRKLSVKRP